MGSIHVCNGEWKVSYFLYVHCRRKRFFSQSWSIIISEWESKASNSTLTSSIIWIAQQFPFLDHFTVCSKGAISLPSQYSMVLTVYIGFLISFPPPTHTYLCRDIYSGKCIFRHMSKFYEHNSMGCERKQNHFKWLCHPDRERKQCVGRKQMIEYSWE